MKTYIYKAVAGVCSLMLLMSSCESFLSEEPKDFLSPENLPNTEAECNMLLMGSLSYWRSNNFERHINFIAEATTSWLKIPFSLNKEKASASSTSAHL